MEENNSDNDSGEGMAIREVKRVPLCYIREAWNTMTISFSRKAHQVRVCKQAMHFWKKESSYGDVLSHVTREEHDMAPMRHTW